MILKTLPVTKKNSFYVTISIGINILIISEHSLPISPQINDLENSWKSIDSELEIEKINSTSLKLTHHEDLRAAGTIRDGYFYVRLRYWLNLAEVIHLKPLNSCNNTNKQVYESQNSEQDIANCKQQLNGFDSARTNILDSYCDRREVSINLTNSAGNNTVFINNLLPSQPYYFYSSVHFTRGDNDSVIVEEKFVSAVCMDEAEPFYPPQTDLGSFKLSVAPQTKIRKNFNPDSRRVELYWRPVPLLLAGSWGLSYQISCSNLDKREIAFSETINEKQMGRMDAQIDLSLNNSYLCILKSKNRIGFSHNHSEIIIPKNSNIIDTKGRFQFYIAEISNGEYLLKWTKMDSLLSNYKSVVGLSKGTYTVYWCKITSAAHGCMDIEGLEQTQEAFHTLLLDGDGTPQNRIFGISYKSNNSEFFTGIMWAECIAAFRTQAQSAYEPIEIYKAVSLPNDHTTISISWSYRGCRSIIALVQNFQIDYCIIKQVDPCSPLTDKSLDDSELLSYGFNDTKVCKNNVIQNKLNTEVTLNNLTASTLYAIRIKHRIENGTTNQWSNPVYAITLAEPIKAKECSARIRKIIESSLVILVALLTTGALYIYVKRKLFHYWSLASQIKKVETQLPQRIDDKLNKLNNEAANDSNDIGLKFWSNRFPDHRSMSGLPTASSESSLDGDEENYDHRNARTNNCPPPLVADYIPNRLITGYVEQSLVTNMIEATDDNQKDIISVGDNSVSSQESFLRTIAEEQVKNNERGT